ncbi:Protein of unknown function [Tistlia consotensis]|uniref:DUF3501 domain-containing protein n=1 Tax=Tistlia consotensis USBA 355 TaxID=560819 RepID=A0A1Y6CMC6_9PROT|nr:DUF3501 family protein [Tistlia consotensis]SMF74712.1 Protein of unknown function [Tistlia consotensis USBA 355]SNS11113.1 Protein of unknown function [Tistlia consotensis]
MSTQAMKREITPADIWPLERYSVERKALKKALVEKKKHRRVEVGPVATFYFENYETMWSQIQEMLWIEKGGDEQLADELSAYNPLIPQGSELVATVMFEIDEKVRREAFLRRLGGIEETAFFEFEGERVAAVPEADIDRTTADGKASSVQFLHFPFTAEQKARFARPGVRVILGFDHPAYSHMAVLTEPVRAALAEDFD